MENVSKITPTQDHMLKVKNINTRTRCEMCLKLTIKTQERRQRLCF